MKLFRPFISAHPLWKQAACCLTMWGGAVPLCAATVTWTGAASDDPLGLWSNLANWSGGTPITSSDLVFGSSLKIATDIHGDRHAQQVTFTSDASNYTTSSAVNSGVLYLYGNNAVTVRGGKQTFNSTIRLREGGSTRTIENDAVLDLNGGLLFHNATGGAAVSITTQFTGSGTTYVKTFTRRFAVDNMAVVKDGSGALVITGTSPGSVGEYGSISGGFTVNAGGLQVGTGTLTQASITNNTVTVNAQGKLAGMGTLSNTLIHGQLAAGDQMGALRGSLTFSTNLSLMAGSTTTFQVAAADGFLSGAMTGLLDPAQSGSNDFVKVNGVLTIANGANVVVDLSGYTPVFGAVFDLFDFASASVISPNFTLTGVNPSAWSLDTSRFNDLGVVALVPEPSKMILLAGSILMLGIQRRRQA